MKKRKLLVSILAAVLALVMLLSLIVSALPMKASAASSSEIREQIEELEEQEAQIQEQIDEIDGQLSTNLSEMQDIVAQKKALDQQVGLLYSQISTNNEQIATYGVLIADKQEELDAATARYDALNEKNKERVRAMEEDGDLSYWSVLFKASSFADLLDRLNMIKEIAAADQVRLEQLNQAALVVEEAKEGLELEKQALEAKKLELAATEQELALKQAEATALLESLRARGVEFEVLMAAAEEEQQKIMREMAVKEEELEEAEHREYMATYYVPGTNVSASGEIPNSGGWVCPVPYYHLSSPFGMRIHPIWGDWRMHEGIDMGLPEGEPIYAAKAGAVLNCGWNDSMGWFVIISHGDGFRSIYMHMTHFIVSSGQSVETGQVIGYVGSTGDSTGPHLHFGISYNGVYVNPLEYIPS